MASAGRKKNIGPNALVRLPPVRKTTTARHTLSTVNITSRATDVGTLGKVALPNSGRHTGIRSSEKPRKPIVMMNRKRIIQGRGAVSA